MKFNLILLSFLFLASFGYCEESAKAKSYPLILSLHGRAGIGDNNKGNLRGWNTKLIGTKQWKNNYPCFVLALQCKFRWINPKPSKGNCKLTSLEGIKHNGWGSAFNYKSDDTKIGYITEYCSDKCDEESNVWKWLFKQHK